MFNAKLLAEPLFVVVFLHTPLTHVVVVQVLPEHTVSCVVLCTRALANVNIFTIVMLDTNATSSPAAVMNNAVLILCRQMYEPL